MAGAFTLTAPDGSVIFSDYPVKGNTPVVFAGQTTDCTFGGTDAAGSTLVGNVILLIRSH